MFEEDYCFGEGFVKILQFNRALGIANEFRAPGLVLCFIRPFLSIITSRLGWSQDRQSNSPNTDLLGKSLYLIRLFTLLNITDFLLDIRYLFGVLFV
jgi:hypothetical protein